MRYLGSIKSTDQSVSELFWVHTLGLADLVYWYVRAIYRTWLEALELNNPASGFPVAGYTLRLVSFPVYIKYISLS